MLVFGFICLAALAAIALVALPPPDLRHRTVPTGMLAAVICLGLTACGDRVAPSTNSGTPGATASPAPCPPPADRRDPSGRPPDCP